MTERRARRSRQDDRPTTGPGEGTRDMRRWLQERIRQLPFRFGGMQPPNILIGTRVVVLKGDNLDDCGRMAIVSRHAGSQVEIDYRGPTGAIKSKRKRPTSLIPLEEGLELIFDDEGAPLIRQMVEQEDEEEENEAPVVSSDEEASRAQ
jgi:hypothetical protein